ncbi:MAG: methylated-DNA--[protein]-cysteine S-methyltransferase [Bacteroidales bacterium]
MSTEKKNTASSLSAIIVRMTPTEHKKGGKALSIDYSYADSPFGLLIVASTTKGVCYMAFGENGKNSFASLKAKFPNASFQHKSDELQQKALSVFNSNPNTATEIILHIKGSEFQVDVWESLLKIPKGKLSTYTEIAKQIGKPKAARSVGTAIGSNPIAYIIPCHRVILTSGKIGGYMWGTKRKAEILAWEQHVSS